MNITSAQMQKTLSGNYNFTQLGFSMMITRFKRAYAKDPSPATLNKCTEEANAYIEKYASIMAQDYSVISGL